MEQSEKTVVFLMHTGAKSDNYRIIQFTPADMQAYKTMRLEALRTEPGLFARSYAEELLFTEDDWMKRLSNPRSACFGLYHSGMLVGITGIVISDQDAHTAHLTQSFIKPSHRGRGLSALLYEARIDWAGSKGVSMLVVGHREGNNISQAANRRFGCTYTHSEECSWGDGTQGKVLWYRLELA